MTHLIETGSWRDTGTKIMSIESPLIKVEAAAMNEAPSRPRVGVNRMTIADRRGGSVARSQDQESCRHFALLLGLDPPAFPAVRHVLARCYSLIIWKIMK